MNTNQKFSDQIPSVVNERGCFMRSLVNRLISTCALLLVACTGDKATAPELVGSVAITSSSTTLQYGQSVQLVATVAGTSGTALTGRTVTWTSSNDNVATVSPSGLVTAGAVRGGTAETAIITAAAEGRSANVSLSVAPIPVATITPSTGQLSLYVGQVLQLGVALKDATGGTLTGRSVTWSSTAPAIASVDNQGLVTAIAPGTSTITLTAENKTASVNVTIALVPISTIQLTPETSTLLVGQTQQLAVTLKDSAGGVLTGRSVAWTSVTPTIAIVTNTGLVTAVSAGTARIAVTAEGKSATATITVNDVVASVVVSPTAAYVQRGKTLQLSASARNAAGGIILGKTVTWTTNAPTIATVSSTGLVTVIGTGTAQIRATIDNKNDVSWLTAWDTCQNESFEIGEQRNTVLVNGGCDLWTARPQASVWRLTASTTVFNPSLFFGVVGNEFWGWSRSSPGIVSMEVIVPLGPVGVGIFDGSYQSKNGSFTFASSLVATDTVSCGGSVGILKNASAPRILGTRDCQTSSGNYFDTFWTLLNAGESITVTMKSADFDAYLELKTDNGSSIVAYDDDSAGGTNARIRYVTTSRGFYQIVARSFQSYRTGQYTIELNP